MDVLGLFSGIGGFELGLQRSGFNISAYCEIEEKPLRVLRRNFPDALEYKDIRHITSGKYDLMCGGFPCQDISIAGKNKGLLKGDKSSLWIEYHRLIKELKPKYAVIENVSALLGRGLEIILQHLAEIGYDATWTTYDTKYFGLPQRRRRVYIIAVRDGITEGTEIFEFERRNIDDERHLEKIQSVEEGFKWDFTQGERLEERFAYFTRQRSDQFAEIGLSGTLAKRDYKSYTDLVVHDGLVRRITPLERLRLQGFPDDWWDDCGLTDTDKYKCNGMSVNVVEHIGRLIMNYDRCLTLQK